MVLIGGKLGNPGELPRLERFDGLGPRGEPETGEALGEDPALLRSLSISAERKISGLACTRNGRGDGRELRGGGGEDMRGLPLPLPFGGVPRP